jgi:hypothetical protein
VQVKQNSLYLKWFLYVWVAEKVFFGLRPTFEVNKCRGNRENKCNCLCESCQREMPTINTLKPLFLLNLCCTLAFLFFFFYTYIGLGHLIFNKPFPILIMPLCKICPCGYNYRVKTYTPSTSINCNRV